MTAPVQLPIKTGQVGLLKIHTGQVCAFIACARKMEILQEILQGMKKTKGRVQHVAAELRSRYESTFCGPAGGEGMVSRLPGNMHERTMRCNVTPEIRKYKLQGEKEKSPSMPY